MIIGSLGEIYFSVTAFNILDHIITFDNFQWGGSANWDTHQRHLGNALTEFTGVAPDTLSMDIRLYQQVLQRKLQWYIGELFTYERTGRPVPLVIGTKPYGKYRWTVLSHSVKAEYYDLSGNLYDCTLSVNLQEYLRE